MARLLCALTVLCSLLCCATAHERGRILAVQEAPFTGSVSIPCSEALLRGASSPQAGASWCVLITYNQTTKLLAKVQSQQAAGNIDPPYGSFFPADAKVPSTAQLATMAGLPLVPQPGWGGGPNVSLSPQPAGTLWGVHTTPYTATVAPSGGAAVRVSWHMGLPVVDAASPVAGTPVSTPSPAAFPARNLNCAGTISLKATGASGSQNTMQSSVTPTCLQYLRNYTKSNVLGRNYLSPVICHAVLGSLASGMSYNFSVAATCNSSVSGITTYTTAAAYGTLPFSFNTPPARSGGGQAVYPMRWAIVADVGQTFNSSLTAQYLKAYASQLTASTADRKGLDVVLNVGDFSYADNYGPTSAAAPSYWLGAPGGTNQQRWDSWFAMWQPALGLASWVSAAGNHELETAGIDAMRLTPTDTNVTYGVRTGNYPFQSFATRVPHGALPPGQWGDIYGSLFFSQNLGPVHVVVLNNYVPFGPSSAQYAFFTADMAAVDRRATPWLVVAFHASAYHSYVVHYKEMECFLSIYEPLFLQYRVDFVFQGHVHAYERTHPVYQYQRHSCGPVYVTIGDGGNIEGPYRNYVDDVVPGSTNLTYCEAAWSSSMNGPPGYQSQVHPPGCPVLSYQGASGVVPGPGALASPLNASLFYCQRSQPVWSAYRDPSFGFAGLTFINDTAAQYAWYRSADQRPGTQLRVTDAVTFTKYTGACGPITNGGSVDSSSNAGPSSPSSSSDAAARPPPPPPPTSWASTIKAYGSGTVGIVAGVLFIVLVIGIGACLYVRHRRLRTAAAAAGASEPDGIHLLQRDTSAQQSAEQKA